MQEAKAGAMTVESARKPLPLEYRHAGTGRLAVQLPILASPVEVKVRGNGVVDEEKVPASKTIEAGEVRNTVPL